MKVFFSNIEIWDIQSQVRIEKYNHIEWIILTWLTEKTSSNDDLWLFFLELVNQFFHFCRRICMVWIYYQSFCFIFILDIFSHLLSSESVCFNSIFSAFCASSRKIILHFADMTQSHQFSISLLMKRNRYRTSFTIWNMTAFGANNPWSVSLFIHNNSDFFSLV